MLHVYIVRTINMLEFKGGKGVILCGAVVSVPKYRPGSIPGKCLFYVFSVI